jgi:hypothetical protein
MNLQDKQALVWRLMTSVLFFKNILTEEVWDEA